MKISLSLLLAAALTVLVFPENIRSATDDIPAGAPGKQIDFGAYHTQLHMGQEWENYSRTGQYADVVVNVAKAGGSLVFWRGNSYLPYWKTEKGQWNFEEMIPRTGDGPEPMPDRNNVYSHVEVIENTPGEVIVYWRYLSSFTAGNPHGKVKLDNFVDETFTITPDGKVTRIVKQATDKIDDWNDPLNQIQEDLQLKEDGIGEVSRKGPMHSALTKRDAANPVNNLSVVNPLLWFKLNEGGGVETIESVTQAVLPIEGPKALWKKGISGTCAGIRWLS